MKTGAGTGLLFISPLGKHLRYVLRLHFPASNNVAEYEALVNGLLKGKCALGPFLSILVIECQHKYLNVNLCPWMNKVQIKS